MKLFSTDRMQSVCIELLKNNEMGREDKQTQQADNIEKKKKLDKTESNTKSYFIEIQSLQRLDEWHRAAFLAGFGVRNKKAGQVD